MGDAADDQFRREVMSRHGVDIGSLYTESRATGFRCAVCGKPFRTQRAVDDHRRDKHQEK